MDRVTVGQTLRCGLLRVIMVLPLGMGFLCVRNDECGSEVIYVSQQEVQEDRESMEALQVEQLSLF